MTDQEIKKLLIEMSREAFDEAMKAGLSVCVKEGNAIVMVHPDGTRTFIKEIPPHGIIIPKFFQLKPLDKPEKVE